MPAADNGYGVEIVDGKCTRCYSGGCYTRYGGTDCASGYSAVYTGRAGGIENYERAHLATLTATFTSKLGLPARPARRVVEYAFHAGDY